MSATATQPRVASSLSLDFRYPPLPKTVADVTALLTEQAELPDTQRLADITAADPIVATSVLRRINSAYYGMRRRVGDIHKAVFLLGFLDVSNLVLTVGMLTLKDVARTPAQRQVFEEIMRLSVGAAAFAQELALFLDLPNRNRAYTVGLLHSIGRLILLYNHRDAYAELWLPEAGLRVPDVKVERRAFGTDYARLGARAIDHWHLPDDVGRAVAHHLTPGHLQEPDERLLALTVGVGVAAASHAHTGPDVPFAATPALYVLAKATGVPADELVECIQTVDLDAHGVKELTTV